MFMTTDIAMTYDTTLCAVIVRFPDTVTEDQMRKWVATLPGHLAVLEGNSSSMLLDTNRHQFESMECLRLLRCALESAQVRKAIRRVAFVQPESFRLPAVVSAEEAYFSTFQDACIALTNDEW